MDVLWDIDAKNVQIISLEKLKNVTKTKKVEKLEAKGVLPNINRTHATVTVHSRHPRQ